MKWRKHTVEQMLKQKKYYFLMQVEQIDHTLDDQGECICDCACLCIYNTPEFRCRLYPHNMPEGLKIFHRKREVGGGGRS